MSPGIETARETPKTWAAPLFALTALVSVTVAGRAAAQEIPNQTNQMAAIHGVVLSTSDKKPVPNVQVQLGWSQRGVLTDEEGRFEFKNVAFGTATLTAKKPGYLCGAVQSAPAPECVKSVDIFQSAVEVTLTMLPQAVISGRIVDQYGKPVAGVHTQLLRRQFDDGKYALMVVAQAQKDTDQEGRFLISGLEPGSYLLATSTRLDPTDRRMEADHGYAATWYPGRTAQSEAKPILLHAGDEFAADMTVRDQKFQEVTASIAWDKPWKTGSIGTSVTGDSLRDGLYATSDLQNRMIKLYAPAGDYSLEFQIYAAADPKTGEQLPWPDGSKQPFMGSVAFTVQDQPLHLTGVRSQQPANIPLRVQAELAEQDKWKSAATPARPYKSPAAGFELTGGEDGQNHQIFWRSDQGSSDLQFNDILPGRYVVRGSILCCNAAAYIASLTCGRTDLLREPLVIGPDAPTCPVVAVIRDDVAQIAIGLTPEAESQLKAAGINVTDAALIPVDEELELPYSAGVWSGSSPKMNMVRPGKYLAFLFDGRLIAWRDPDERQRLMKLGSAITIAPGESKTIPLDWLPELNDPRKQPLAVGLGQVLP